MKWIKFEHVPILFERALNYVDPRLIDHGKRVAYLVSKMLDEQDKYDEDTRQKVIMLSLMHDIGAYRTEEIDRMVQFEADNVNRHTVYGYLFIRELSPIPELARIVLFHHTRYDSLIDEPRHIRELAQMICLSDRVDIFHENYGADRPRFMRMLREDSGKRFDPAIVDVLMRVDKRGCLFSEICNAPSFSDFVGQLTITEHECECYLHMIVSSIDFRSHHTVTHTMNTIFLSRAIAKEMGLNGEELLQITFGALLHDIGKIGTPVEILESPGKLTPDEMEIMREHAVITAKVTADIIDPVVARIAARHHEKLDGSGYPQHLTAQDLTLPERIVGVGDIISALHGTRSYKDAYPEEKIKAILNEMKGGGLLDARVVDAAVTNLSRFLAETNSQSLPIINIYDKIQSEYTRIMRGLETRRQARL